MTRKTRKQATVLKDYVTVAFAEDMELAQEYVSLLAEHDIQAVTKNMGRSGQDAQFSIAVMVPEECMDEAYVLISEEASYDDFFEAAFNDTRFDNFDTHDPSFYDDDDEELDVF